MPLLSWSIHSILIVVKFPETFSVGGDYVFTLANLGHTLQHLYQVEKS